MADKFVYVFYKVGDATNGIKHGEPICYIDPVDYDIEAFEKTLSDNMKKVFLFTKVNREKIKYIKDILKDEEEPKKHKVNFKKLETKKGLNYDLEAK